MDPFCRGIAGQISEVRRSGGELHAEWRIPGFLDLPCGGLNYYASPRFRFHDARWHLEVYPKWNLSGDVSLFLRRDDDDDDDFLGPSTRTVNVSLCVRGSGGGVEWRREEEREFRKNSCWSLVDIFTRSELRKQKERLMPGGALTVECVMKMPGTTVRETEKLSEDLGRVLTSGDNSDVTLQVGEQEFQAHSFILFARCPALSVSLRHDSAERSSNRIVVEECDPDIFRDFLRFLYTGSVQSLTKDNAFALYRIADRYLVDDLKRRCLEQVQDAMSVDTFCDAARLAVTHAEDGLMKRALAFAAQNMQSILGSEEWQTFKCECPDEANEVLMKSVVPPPKRSGVSREWQAGHDVPWALLTCNSQFSSGWL